MEIHVDAEGNVTPNSRRGLFIAVVTDGTTVSVWNFTCPECEGEERGEWPVVIQRSELPYDHNCDQPKGRRRFASVV